MEPTSPGGINLDVFGLLKQLLSDNGKPAVNLQNTNGKLTLLFEWQEEKQNAQSVNPAVLSQKKRRRGKRRWKPKQRNDIKIPSSDVVDVLEHQSTSNTVVISKSKHVSPSAHRRNQRRLSTFVTQKLIGITNPEHVCNPESENGNTSSPVSAVNGLAACSHADAENGITSSQRHEIENGITSSLHENGITSSPETEIGIASSPDENGITSSPETESVETIASSLETKTVSSSRLSMTKFESHIESVIAKAKARADLYIKEAEAELLKHNH